MRDAKTVQGPASYVPSIERTSRRPIDEWKALIRASERTKHMELVSWLTDEHGLAHRPANALVAHALAEDRAGG